jgi:fatty acid desaturase
MNREIHNLTSEFADLRPALYWSDLVLSAVLCWSAFAYIVYDSAHSPAGRWLAGLVAVIFAFRGLAFMHEVAHSGRHLPGFTLGYNLLFGFPFKSPAHAYEPHAHHHSRSRFGTLQDPEYETWSHRSPWSILRPLLLIPFVPFAFFARYSVAPVILLFLPRSATLWVFRHYSTYAMNSAYVREPDDEGELGRSRRQDWGCVAYTLAMLAANLSGLLPWSAWKVGYWIVVGISAMNFYRALANHRYLSGFGPQSYEEQVLDSVTITGGPWTEIWAPTGLRYHSTHHMLPALPYHSLGRAHRKLMRVLPADHPYRRTVEPSLYASLRSLVGRMIANGASSRREASATAQDGISS